MRKNTDLHLKIRTVTVKKPFGKKRFCEDKRIDFFGEVFLGFLIGVITAWVHWRIVSFYEGFLTVFPNLNKSKLTGNIKV